MAYNLMCESPEKVNWNELQAYTAKLTAVEILPMPDLGPDGGDAIGICIPAKNVGKKAWREMRSLVLHLIKDPQLCIYDLYSGKRITGKNLREFRSQIVC